MSFTEIGNTRRGAVLGGDWIHLGCVAFVASVEVSRKDTWGWSFLGAGAQGTGLVWRLGM